MPSPRRMRLLVIAALGTVVFILFYTSGIESEPDNRTIQDFYHKTKNAMDGRNPKGQAVIDTQTRNQAGQIPADKDGDGDVDEDDAQIALKMQERLKAAEQKAKDKANEKAGLRPDPPSNVIGVGSSADGQHKLDKPELDDGLDKSDTDKTLGKSGKGDKSKVGDTAAAKGKKPAESDKSLEAEQELVSILKKSPVIIFSKSYCPYSKRAKGVLLEKYTITPEPYVVELDEHKLGPNLQDVLEEKTGRRTVPNVMINGISIGGADDVIALDNDDELINKIVDLGNGRVEMTERFVSGGSRAQ